MAQIITGFNGYLPILGDDGNAAAQGSSAMKFQSLTNGSTPQQVADAYREWIGQNGGDTEANRNTAAQYLTNLGFSPENIGSTYNLYKDTFNTAAAPAAGSHTVTPAPRTSPFQMGPRPTMQGYDQKNPYLDQMAGSITSQVNDNLTRNVLPAINSGAMAAGQYGGSRQGVVQANALNDANKQLSNALTGMYYGDYNNAMNRNLQQYGMDMQYNLGLGGLQNQALNRDENARQFDQNFGLQSDQFGFNAAMALNNYNNAMTNMGLGMGSDIYNAPMGYYGNFANYANSLAGQGGVSSQNFSGNPMMGAMGGAVLGGKMGNLFSNQSSPSNAQIWNQINGIP